MIFDPKKLVMTRDGRIARIICMNARLQNNISIIALVENEDGSERLVLKSDELHRNQKGDPDDLVNVTEYPAEVLYKSHLAELRGALTDPINAGMTDEEWFETAYTEWGISAENVRKIKQELVISSEGRGTKS